MRDEGAYQLSPMDLSDFHHQPGGEAWPRQSNFARLSQFSLRSKRFHSSFFLLSSQLSGRTREETLATQAIVPVNTFRSLFRATGTCDVFTFETVSIIRIFLSGYVLRIFE